jgi:rfaE bifunctional protein nucleotidyltransferase chain/domain
MAQKIVTLDQLRSILEEKKNAGLTVVHCHGCFDLLHLGHIRHFQLAKEQGDILVVTITQDEFVNKGPDRPFFNQNYRAEVLSNLEVIDYVAINKWPNAVETIKLLKPSVYVKGSEYRNEEKDISGGITAERDAVEKAGGKIYFTEDITFSSSNLINRGMRPPQSKLTSFLQEFQSRYNFEKIEKVVQDLSKLKVLVIGDTILDEYHFVSPIGMPTKAATVSAKYLSSEIHAGGILAIANHISSFADKVDLITGLGDLDQYDEFIKMKLSKNINPTFIKKKNSLSTKKTRYVDQNSGSKLLEVAAISEFYPDPTLESEMLSRLNDYIKTYDMVVLADFGHYTVTPAMTELLSDSSKFFAVNVQTNSLNFGFNTINKIKSADFISIDEREMRLAVQNKLNSREELINSAIKNWNFKKMAITLGGDGVLLSDRKSFANIPALTHQVYDTVGAGDAFLSVSSLVAKTTDDLELIGFMGNMAGAIATKYLGNKEFVQKKDVLNFAKSLLK